MGKLSTESPRFKADPFNRLSSSAGGRARLASPAPLRSFGAVRFPPSRLLVASALTGTRYHVSVAPPDPARAPGPWPALVVLDADDQFEAALDAYRALWARGVGVPLLLVGVGYGASYREPANRRIRDYTPTPLATEGESGGAEAFHEFLVTELWPRLQREYPLRPDGHGLAGHSLGALLVLHALFRPAPFFTRALASAPSIWWDDRAILRRIAACREQVAALPARLFLAVGEQDTESMRGDLALLERQLAERPFEGLRVTARRFPDRDHDDVIGPAYAAGLQDLFG